MPYFGKHSLELLNYTHDDFVIICNEIIKYYDITVLTTVRTKEMQNKAYNEGKSGLKWPESKHNSEPSLAIDIAPYPINWDNIPSFYYLGGMFEAFAEVLYDQELITHKIRWGGDWDGDADFTDQKFNDLVHYELII